ncbi:acyl-CoA desaturase [Nocardioides anomalus]|uniref:Acyl-CoA desaturase n=2 Tax=Nocardioides anomalus TaxID=2712223 RepID=A0A6G6WM23_9ACTN|nr:acyl-CoA desaturase [Nocardioides anomalus]
MARCYGYYWSRITMALLALAAVVVALVLVGDSWFQLLVAAGLGVVLTQLGFLGHDAAHRQVFRSAEWNEWTARLLSAGVGLSYGWWRGKHNRHHAGPNQVGRDPDIAPGVLALTPEVADARTEGARGWFTRHQGWLLLPLLTLEGLNLQVAGTRSLLVPGERHRLLELGLILLRTAGYVVLLLVLLPTGKAAAFFGLQTAVFGLLLGGAFAPNHIGMPIVPRASRLDFLHRQVLTSRNITGGRFVDAVMGGLNHQVEHHLFPSMPRPRLRRVRPVVRDYCAEQGVPYTEMGLLAAYAVVIDHLNHVGVGARATFDCPLAARLRG